MMQNQITKTSLPDHLIDLPGGEWALWRWMGLRSAGFPANNVLKLAAPEAAALADTLYQAEDEIEQLVGIVLKELNICLDQLRATGQWDDKEKRYPLLKATRAMKKGRVPESSRLPADIAAKTDRLQMLHAQMAQLQTSFARVFDDAICQMSQAIYEIAQDDAFQEAVIWQNRHVFQRAIRPLLAQPPDQSSRNYRRRSREELVVKYWHRYCVKNDTIGFFGPVGWGKWHEEEIVNVQPGVDLLEERNVYFEQWCIDVLAQEIDKDKALRPWLIPRRLPDVRIEGTTLYLPNRHTTIPLEQAVLLQTCLQACDGKQSATKIAQELIRQPNIPMTNKLQVFSLLDYMRDAGLLIWQLDVPFAPRAESKLRRRLALIEHEPLRKEKMGILDQIESCRQNIIQAAGNALELDKSISRLEKTFTSLANESATRAHGKTYAARTLVYEDCRRNIKVDLGAQLLETLGPPLSLLLTSARWLTHQVADEFRQAFKGMYVDLAQKQGTITVDLLDFWHKAQGLLYGANLSLVDKVINTFQDKWAAILDVPSGTSHVTYTYADLEPQVQSAFFIPHDERQFVPFHSPDVMIVAESVEAIRRGKYHFVMGELHVGNNTLRASLFVNQHPQPEEIYCALEQDLPDPSVMPLPPKHWPKMSGRFQPAFLLPQEFRLVFTPEACDDPVSQTLAVGDLVVENHQQKLVALTRDGQMKFDLLTLFSQVVALQIVDAFQLLHSDNYSPRLSIDRLTISRETWRFSSSTLEFVHENDEMQQFLLMRRWVKQEGLPRFVFVKSPAELKPIFVDFESPISITILIKLIKLTLNTFPADTKISMTEMLPDFDNLWLHGVEGESFTSELRLVAVEQRNYENN